MINSFTFSTGSKIIFGIGKINSLPDLTVSLGKNILLIYGSKSLKKFGRLDKIYNDLKLSGCKVFAEQINTEPYPYLIDNISGLYHKKNIEVVIAIGGGSVLDAGKAISAMLPLNESVKDFLEGVGSKKPDGRKVPFIAIPTTSGTGSETTKNAVISEIGSNGFKKSLRHNNYFPDIALVDPELTLSCSPEITAASGLDAFTQLLESYLSDQCDIMTQSLIYSGLEAVKRSLLKVCQYGDDINSRTDMSYAAMISGIGLSNAGLGIIHGFASPIGGFFEIPHGIVCGTLMAACNKYTLKNVLENNHEIPLLKYNKVAGLFLDDYLLKNQKVNNFIDYLYDLSEKLHIPVLSNFNISEYDFKKIIDNTSNKNNPVKLNEQDMFNILTERL